LEKSSHRIDAGSGQQREDAQRREDLLQWTSNIVAAYLSKNEVDVRLLPQVLETVYGKLSALGHLPTRQLQPTPFDQVLGGFPNRVLPWGKPLVRAQRSNSVFCRLDGLLQPKRRKVTLLISTSEVI